MVYILRWISVDNHLGVEQTFRVGLLWGYPDLLEKLYGEVRSALAEECDKGVEGEKEEQQETTEEYLNNVREVMEVNEDDTASAPPQFDPPVPLDEGPEPLALTQTDSQPDRETKPIDHPPTSNGRLSTAATATTEALDPTSGCHIPQADIGEAASSPDEIEEVPRLSTPSNNDEELHMAQSKEE